MPGEQLSPPIHQFDQQRTNFRLLDPDDYARLGIDSEDVPMGTFAAEDHPTFLPSRFGGNAYGLGIIEHGVLSAADTNFLESLDLQNTVELGRHAKRLNAIFQKLGLLIRFSRTGKSYYLIPINLVAHSLQEITTKADEIERLIIQYIFETRAERLDIGLLTKGHDLLVHELTARLSSHRIFLFESLKNLNSWRIPLDIAILPKDPVEYLLEQKLPKPLKGRQKRRRLHAFSAYLAGKIYDLLKPGGRVLLLSHSFDPLEDRTCTVRFKADEELRDFLLFSHIFKTRKRYQGYSAQAKLDVYLSDLHYYLNKFAFFETHLKRLLGHDRAEHLPPEAINALPYLNMRLHRTHMEDPEKQWKLLLGPYFTARYSRRKFPKHPHQQWKERLELEAELPESLLVFVGERRQPRVSVPDLETDLHLSGMQGCSLPLVAEYRDSFQYLLDVLRALIHIRDHRLTKLPELEQARLSNPFLTKNESFRTIAQLLGQIPKLERIQDTLNPEHIEGHATRVLENLSKLSLLGLSREQLREILLIVVGYTTMSRVVFGKIPAKSLKPLTDKAKEGPPHKILELLRFCRLMSMAEIVAVWRNSFTPEHSRELFRLYNAAVAVATYPWLDWERLHDLRISALGGVQNMAIREMMKFFNLFEFLGNWQDLLRKGELEREVACDYEPEKLQQMGEALVLSRLAADFNHRFLTGDRFGQSNFFRQFLETEFHGTGHLFPMLGAEAGFLLLWIAVNVSDRRLVNFNPMLAGMPQDRLETRITKIKETLLQIPLDTLAPSHFDRIRRTLAEGLPAFIPGTGIRFINNSATRAADVSFVDVEEDIQQIEALLGHFGRQKLSTVSLKHLNELERPFSELASFHRNLQHHVCSQNDGSLKPHEIAGLPDRIGSKIGEIERRLKMIMHNHILVPEEIHDTVNSLARHCPEIFRFVLPELSALGNPVAEYPAPDKQSLAVYVMRCLLKFQALVRKDRNAFQDRNIFYQQAKEEFGPLAEEGIGATHSQLDLLEYIVESMQQRPMYLRALMAALLFQEIGNIDACAVALPAPDTLPTSAERGALILDQTDLLEQYHVDLQMKDLAILLVRHHGLIGRLLQGEEPVPILERLTASQDEQFLDALVLQAVLNTAAAQEGLLVADLLDGLLNFRAIGHHLIQAKSTWRVWLEESLLEKGKAVMPEFCFAEGSERAQRATGRDSQDSSRDPMPNKVLRHGRQAAAFERLLRMMRIMWVDFQDLQMFLMKMPIAFIYYKKKLKSVGLATFEAQLNEAVKIFQLVSRMPPDAQYGLLDGLDHLGGSVRVHDFHILPEFLEIEASVKLLMLSLQMCWRYFGPEAENSLILFGPLSQKIEKVHSALQRDLRHLPFPECRGDQDGPSLSDHGQSSGCVHFEPNLAEQTIRVDYRYTIPIDLMEQSLATIWDREVLQRRFHELVEELRRKLPFDARDFEEALAKAFEAQQKKISDQALAALQEQLGVVGSFSAFHELEQTLERQQVELQFSEEQRFLLKEIFEFHRSRTRDRYLDAIYQKINTFRSGEELTAYWNSLKYELFSYRAYLGKEYESLIAQFIEQKLAEMERTLG